MEPNGKDLIDFWDFASSKGLVKKDWANSLRSAARQVLVSVEPDSWEKIDLTDLDIDSFIQRFERLRMGDLKPDSLAVYGKRFRNATTAYLDYLRSPSTWQYSSGRPEATKTEGRKPTRSTPKRRSASATPVEQGDHPAALNSGETQVISYPYPLRQGLVVTLNLPADLTKFEAKRLAAYVDSLAMDQQPALPSGEVK